MSATTALLADPELQSTEWDLGDLVEGEGEAGVERQLDRATELAEEFAAARPDLAVTNMRKELRRGKVLIDWSQNVPAKTTVAPYSLRAEESPSVSTPLRWEEVEGVANGAPAVELRFAPDQVLQRVEAAGDLFAPLLQKRR